MTTAKRADLALSAKQIRVLVAIFIFGVPVALATDWCPGAPVAGPAAGDMNSDNHRPRGPIRRSDRNPVAPAAQQAAQVHGTAKRLHTGGGFPTWTGSFSRGDVVYSYAMIGTDPRNGPATTIVQAVIIPIRFEFPDVAAPDFGGVSVFDAGADLVDGQTAISGILRSPVFTPYPFTIGGVKVGTTQFGDAYQRADFWSELGAAKDYHVLLTPTVTPTQSIVVPLDQSWEEYDQGAGVWRPLVPEAFLGAQITSIIAAMGISPKMIPIFVTGPVEAVEDGGAHCCRGLAPGGQTWIHAAYESVSQFGGFHPDVSILGHEILELMNHPSGISDVAGWPMGPGDYTDWCYDRILEVADPLEGDTSTAAVPLAGKSFTYHVPDAVFIDFFTHRSKSRSAGGLYSLFGNARGPSGSCVGDSVYQTTVVDVPGAIETVLNGINDEQDLVGYYYDQNSVYHAFVRRRGQFQQLNAPGAVYTQPSAINRSGQIAGVDYDGISDHAFLLNGGVYRTLDFPGASNTFANNLNSWGDVVGGYVDAAGLTHGFLCRNGKFSSIDAPQAVNSVVSGINDSGDMTVAGLDANLTLVGAYVRIAGTFTLVRFPGDTHDTTPAALDNQGRIAGIFSTDYYGFTDGFVTQPDGSYVRLPQTPLLNGMNNSGQVVGARDGHGFIATLPVSNH
jgi:uncharacterized membrane protein